MLKRCKARPLTHSLTQADDKKEAQGKTGDIWAVTIKVLYEYSQLTKVNTAVK